MYREIEKQQDPLLEVATVHKTAGVEPLEHKTGKYSEISELK